MTRSSFGLQFHRDVSYFVKKERSFVASSIRVTCPTRLLNFFHNPVRYRTVFRIVKSDSRVSKFSEQTHGPAQGRSFGVRLWLRSRF
jgi:hypothetical protein